MYWFLTSDNLFNNWGLAIIFLTVALKLLTWPLSAKACFNGQDERIGAQNAASTGETR